MNHQNYSYEGGAGFPNNQGAGVDFHNNKDDPFANDDRESQGNRPNNQGGADFHNQDDPIANDDGEFQVGNPNNQGGADFHNQDDLIANDDGEFGLDGEALISFHFREILLRGLGIVLSLYLSVCLKITGYQMGILNLMIYPTIIAMIVGSGIAKRPALSAAY